MRLQENLTLTPLRDCPECLDQAARWFAAIWEIPEAACRESRQACLLRRAGIPQWYIVRNDQQAMVAGAGVSGNDFHERKDLAPNLCALYVDETCRGRGIARRMQDFIRRDRGAQGVCRCYRMMDLAWHSIKNAAGNSWAWLEATAMRGNAWTARKHTGENACRRGRTR